jgi:phage shock protein A
MKDACRRAGKEFFMALLDRVATLVRANLNDLLDKAENPEKMLKQVILDMDNQFMQVKTQVAIALADLHILEKKRKENNDARNQWMSKAELAVEKQDDELARAALDRALSFQQLAENFDQQIADQEAQVEALKSALKRLELKISEARAKAELLIVEHRRSRGARRAGETEEGPNGTHRAFEQLRSRVAREEAIAKAGGGLRGDDVEVRLDALERERKIDALLRDIKAKKGIGA